nr:ATP synthase F0 subunit 6 [Thlaspida biramosa]
MMTNLFSSFDPSTNLKSLNWLSMLLIFMLIPSIYWFIPSRMSIMWLKMVENLNKEIKVITPEKEMSGLSLMMISMFLFIIVSNFMGLFPYIFTSTSHIVVSLTLALPLWVSLMIFGWTIKTLNMFAHMVPQGTPTILMPFMVCIETVSNIIRPVTLAIRLSANMIAGHLLMTLLGSVGSLIPPHLVILLIIVQNLLLILEMSVSMIQAYVFMILTTLYSKEVN